MLKPFWGKVLTSEPFAIESLSYIHIFIYTVYIYNAMHRNVENSILGDLSLSNLFLVYQSQESEQKGLSTEFEFCRKKSQL